MCDYFVDSKMDFILILLCKFGNYFYVVLFVDCYFYFFYFVMNSKIFFIYVFINFKILGSV